MLPSTSEHLPAFSKLDWGLVRHARWHTPFTSHRFDLTKCTGEKAFENWSYKDTFIRDDDYVRSAMTRVSRRSFLAHLKRLQRIA